MFARPIQHLHLPRRIHTVSQCLLREITFHRSYATFGEKYKRCLNTVEIKPLFSNLYFLRYTSQQEYLVKQTKKNVRPNIEQAIGKLESAYQWNGFIGTEHLQPLLDIFQKDPSIKLTYEQGLFLLNVCGCEMPSLNADNRLQNFQKIWQILQQSNQITKEHYITMLQIFKFNRTPLSDYKIFLQEYEKHKGTAKDIYSPLLEVAGASGNVKQTTELLAEMRSMQIALTEHDFNSLLLAHSRAKDMDGFQTVCDSMHATGISVSTETQSTLILAYMENEDEAKALQILKQYHGQFHSDEILKILQSIMLTSQISRDFVSELVKEFSVDYVKGPEVPLSLRRICVELLHNE